MLNPDDRWIWDFWHIHDQDLHHLFYLQAPKSLGDPELRHRNATIGHATSTDLITWTEHGTVLTPGSTDSIDASATWTGSVVRGDDGLWRMFYTGSTFLTADTLANMEVIGVATSTDLYTWTKDESFALRAEKGTYETLGDSEWPEECWRDPWVYRGQDDRWHMLITARATTGDLYQRGVIGHATSTDLNNWKIEAPLTEPGKGYGHLEVLQQVTVRGERVAVFSVHDGAVPQNDNPTGTITGTWTAPWSDRIHLDQARKLTGPDLYSGRIIDLDGEPVLLAFEMTDTGTTFVGGIIDPVRIDRIDGHLVLADNIGAH
jgi:beta-fructofuranosidase